MVDTNRDDAGELGWFPARIFHAARRERSSTTVGITLLSGSAGLFLWHLFNLWALRMAIGNDLPAAMYHVLAGILIANVVCYELLRNLVSNRRKVVLWVCRDLGRVLWPARAACKLTTLRVVLRTAARVVENALTLLKTMASVMGKAARRLAFAVIRSARRVAAYPTIFLKAVLSFTWKGVTSAVYAVLCTPRRVVVNAAYFINTTMFQRWRGTRQANADEHGVRRLSTIDEPLDGAEAVNVLPPKRRRDSGAVSKEMQRPSQRMAFRSSSHVRPSNTAPPQTKSSPPYQKQGECKGAVRDGSKKHDRAPTPERPSMRAEQYDAPASERVRQHGKKARGGSSSPPPQTEGLDDMEVEEPTQTTKSSAKRELEDKMDGPSRRVKREHSTDDSSLFKAASRGSLSLPRGSFGGGGSGGVSRDRAAINTGGKNKRCRSSAAVEEKSANRRRLDKTREVHCCEADPVGMVEAWVCAPSFDEAGGEAVPGVFHYLPVTLIQQTSKRAAGDKVSWYVQPGGRDMQTTRSEEGGRVVWKVPAECLFHKAPAESGKACDTCGKTGEGKISSTPDKSEHTCDSCADAPRRNLQRHYDARDLGFERARACGCEGW